MESLIPVSTSGFLYWEDICPPRVSMRGKAVHKAQSHCPASTGRYLQKSHQESQPSTGGGCVSQLGPLWSTQVPHISVWLQDLISAPVLVAFLMAHRQFLELPVIVWMKSCRKTLQGLKLCCLGPESRLRVTVYMLHPILPGHPSFQRQLVWGCL